MHHSADCDPNGRPANAAMAIPISSGPPSSTSKKEASRQAALDRYAIVDTPAEQAYDDIVALACMLCEAPVATISLIDRERCWFKARIGIGVTQTARSEALCDLAIRRPLALLEVPDIAVETQLEACPVDAANRTLRFYAGVPLLSPEGFAIGTLCVLDHAPRRLSDAQRSGLQALGRQTQALLRLRHYGLRQRELLEQRLQATQRLERERAELQRRHDHLEHEASHDPLTGLLNRSALARLRVNPEALQRLNAGGYTLAVVDIDHFKQVNDRHGHLLGDQALRTVAQAISQGIRRGDVAVRYGGEEFLLILPSTPLAGAFELAERIREAVERVALPFPLSVSIGLAAGDPQADRPEEVFERADQALYRAKAGGRNRVVADDTPRVND